LKIARVVHNRNKGRLKHRDRGEGAVKREGEVGGARDGQMDGVSGLFGGSFEGVITAARKCGGQLLHGLTRCGYDVGGQVTQPLSPSRI